MVNFDYIHKKLFLLILESPTLLSTSDIAEKMNISLYSAKYRLNNLEDHKLIMKSKKNNRTYYIATEDYKENYRKVFRI